MLCFEGRTVYEWEQSLEEVNIYIKPPEGVKASMIECKIQKSHLRLAIKGNPPYIDVSYGYYWLNERNSRGKTGGLRGKLHRR